MQKPIRAAGVAAVAAALFVLGVLFAPAVAPTPALAAAPAELMFAPGLDPVAMGQMCVDRKAKGTAGLSSRAKNWLTDCIAIFGQGLTPNPTESPSASPSSSPSVSPSASPTPSPTPTPTPTPTECGDFPLMPAAACTGVPAGVTLTECNSEITQSGTYDSCLWSDSVQVMACNVTITRSKVLGRVGDGGMSFQPCGQYDDQRALSMTDFEVDGSSLTDPVDKQAAAIGQSGYTCLRCNVHHTGRGASMGDSVVLRDSYFHDFKGNDGDHMSAAGSNGGGNNVIVHNTFDCISVTGLGACSGAFVMYGDFAPIDNWLIQNNWFASPGSYCVYAGSLDGKPFPNATNVVFLANLWSKKYTPQCGEFGPVTGWEPNSGNSWNENRYTTGELILV